MTQAEKDNALLEYRAACVRAQKDLTNYDAIRGTAWRLYCTQIGCI